MRTKLLITGMLTIGIIFTCYSIKSGKGHFNELAQTNVEALSFNEWGGGNDMGGGVIVQYEYEQIDFFYKYCRPKEYAPYDWCSCYSKTCHGYGDEFCFGILYCSPVGDPYL